MKGVGKWEKKEKRKFDWLKNEGKIYMGRLIKINMQACIDKIINTVGKKRIMTELQKVLYCNPFIVPKIIHEFKIIPLNRKRVEKCNKIIHRFIWSRKIEKLKLEETYPGIKERGMNLVDIFIKRKSIFLDAIIRLVMNEGTNNNLMNYWLNFLTKKTNTSKISFIQRYLPQRFLLRRLKPYANSNKTTPKKT
jgi:hypothetical protein